MEKDQGERLKKTAYIGIGGFLGAIARYGFKNITIYDGGAIPVNTLLINIAGSFALAFLLAVSFRVFPLDSDRKAALTTGFMGAFTTFSAFCRETVNLFTGGAYFSALFYVCLSVLAGLAAAWLGQFAAGILNAGQEEPEALPTTKEMEYGAE